MTISDDRRRQLESFRDTYVLEGISLELLDHALTHRSWAFEREQRSADNERLEFLGDAVLGCLAAEYLYRVYPDSPEGELSKMKAFLVSREELGRRAIELHLADLLRLGHGEEASGGRKRSSILGSALEAVAGAMYMSASFSTLQTFSKKYVFEPVKESLESGEHLDFKSQLQEYAQQQGGVLPEYRKVGQEGPPHQRRFTVEVYLDDRLLGRGTGKRIKSAQNAAAREACKNWMQEP
ncbi:MAG: ribonuclease III [Candidatus Sumerlaeota bacterium]